VGEVLGQKLKSRHLMLLGINCIHGSAFGNNIQVAVKDQIALKWGA